MWGCQFLWTEIFEGFIRVRFFTQFTAQSQVLRCGWWRPRPHHAAPCFTCILSKSIIARLSGEGSRQLMIAVIISVSQGAIFISLDVPRIPGLHDDVIKWKHFPRHWPFVRWIHRSPVKSRHMPTDAECWCLPFICAMNKRLSKQSWGWWFETNRTHYDIIVMLTRDRMGFSVIMTSEDIGTC